jgi:hypothetical protein
LSKGLVIGYQKAGAKLSLFIAWRLLFGIQW